MCGCVAAGSTDEISRDLSSTRSGAAGLYRVIPLDSAAGVEVAGGFATPIALLLPRGVSSDTAKKFGKVVVSMPNHLVIIPLDQMEEDLPGDLENAQDVRRVATDVATLEEEESMSSAATSVNRDKMVTQSLEQPEEPRTPFFTVDAQDGQDRTSLQEFLPERILDATNTPTNPMETPLDLQEEKSDDTEVCRNEGAPRSMD